MPTKCIDAPFCASADRSIVYWLWFVLFLPFGVDWGSVQSTSCIAALLKWDFFQRAFPVALCNWYRQVNNCDASSTLSAMRLLKGKHVRARARVCVREYKGLVLRSLLPSQTFIYYTRHNTHWCACGKWKNSIRMINRLWLDVRIKYSVAIWNR